VDPSAPDDQKVRALRDLLPGTGAGIVLDLPTAGLLPAETHRALLEADDWELRVGRGGADHAADAELRRDEARGVLAAVLGTSPERVLPVMGVRAAVGALVAAANPTVEQLTLEPGLDPGVAAAALQAAGARGWAIGLPVEAGGPSAPHRPEDGGLVLAPAIRADDGTPVDLAALRRRMPLHGLLVVDLSLAAGAIDLSALPRLTAVLATDRWLLGPDGTAAIVADHRWLQMTMGMVDPLARRAALGLARSVGWLLMYVGLPWAVARTERLAARLRRGLAAVAGAQVHGGVEAASPVVVFTIDGWTPDQAADELGRRVFAVTGRTPDGAALRLGVGAWNTEDEVERFTRAVAELAAHTPDTLPQRPAITVLGGG
jgi:selenocysteine lyase/cysteine desulfurase